MVKKLSCVSNGSLKRFPHTFTTYSLSFINKHALWFYIEIRLNLVPTSNMDVFYTDLHLSHCNCLRF